MTPIGGLPATSKCKINVALAAGGSCVFTIGFRPSQVGTRTATLRIFDLSGGGPAPVTLTGVGTP